MKQDMIVILDLGSHHNTAIAREIRNLGVYSEIKPHDITASQLSVLPNVKGIILSGGENNVIDGKEIDVLPEIYAAGLPILSIAHPLSAMKTIPFPDTGEKLTGLLAAFVLDTCKAEKNWDMKNFVADQIDLIRAQVGNRKVLLALSGGVDSSVVAAILIKAIGKQLVCVHVNHGLMRKGESEDVIEVFQKQLGANLIYV
ncbi:MAG: glutamine-hydrolyzing GMP synthase, partial [Oscillospiraceae bacterium]